MMWDDKADGLLISLWNEGGSLGFVADGMMKAGYTVSRNSVAGRKHRLTAEAFKRIAGTPIKVLAPVKPKVRSNNVTVLPPRKPPTEKEIDALAAHEGVEYLDNGFYGCKAIMPGPRSGPWALQRVCGKPRSLDYNGSMSPYCATHFRLFTHGVARKV
jgi:hypothetical protein